MCQEEDKHSTHPQYQQSTQQLMKGMLVSALFAAEFQ
jgi:hypothetical protein